jgi:polysaccharide biosynthesis/export protein
MTSKLKRQAGHWLMVVSFLTIAACNNPSIMFRAKRNYPFQDLSKIEQLSEYKIGINDILSIKVTTNKGANLIEPVSSAGSNESSEYTATVEFDGTVKMPLLGRVKLIGLTIRECELLFEEQYKLFFIEPFATVDIINKRVIIFPGSSGNASVVTLKNRNTSLIEVLAGIGGIRGTGKSHRIKLIRGDFDNPQVYMINLSRIEGLKNADIILQGNDIIYIEPRDDYVLNFISRIAPYVSLLNLGLLVYALIPGK